MLKPLSPYKNQNIMTGNLFLAETCVGTKNPRTTGGLLPGKRHPFFAGNGVPRGVQQWGLWGRGWAPQTSWAAKHGGDTSHGPAGKLNAGHKSKRRRGAPRGHRTEPQRWRGDIVFSLPSA